MDKQDDSIIKVPFDALRAELAGINAPRCVEKELMQAFARQFPRRLPRRRWYQRFATPRWSIPASLASAALVVLLFVLAPAPGLHRGDARMPASRDSGAAFIALASLERIEQEPAPRVVATEVPRSALAPLGVPVTPENAGGSVMAEMLVGADGHPLALRLTSIY